MYRKLIGMALLAQLAFAYPAWAGVARGTIYQLEGHVNPACRVLIIKRETDSALAYFRIPDTGTDNSILAVAMMAFSQKRKVTLVYSDGGTTGCGTEPRIDFLRVTDGE
ncbi:hypothetical protein [Sphingomonas sp. S-NIH.Pt15_0812]|jgi:hypothetical protein|uniref:hypothetical protein n=1 Tax=Sphingomonas sp. S-NIH.Pt15_0812 TaxID=1920129 RepID=UPI000F7F7FFB|nr:hypothetical protein [Sphingomonas sp. S-NIH.Pt15_0812]